MDEVSQITEAVTMARKGILQSDWLSSLIPTPVDSVIIGGELLSI